MDPASSQQFQFIVLICLMLLSCFFSASETALTSINKLRLRSMVEEGVKNADKINAIIHNSKKFLSTILIGNTLANIGASALATTLAYKKFGNIGVGISTGILTVLILVFCEVTPKTFATQNAEAVSKVVINPILFCVYIMTPFVIVMNFITGSILKLLGVTNKKQPIITEAELKTIVNVSHEEGVLEIDERRMINNVFEFGDNQAKDVMTTRTDIVAIDKTDSYTEIINTFKNEQFSRLPVYEESIDNIVGILHLKDIIFLDTNDKTFKIEEYIREPFFTYEPKSISELFAEMRTNRIPVAIVLDEYGGTSGIITIEDLVEEIVGDIADEYDEVETEIEVIKEDEYVVEGSTKISDVNEMLGINLESSDFDSIGGYVIGIIGRLPEQGETIDDDSIRFIVEEIDKNRIEKIRIHTQHVSV